MSFIRYFYTLEGLLKSNVIEEGPTGRKCLIHSFNTTDASLACSGALSKKACELMN